MGRAGLGRAWRGRGRSRCVSPSSRDLTPGTAQPHVSRPSLCPCLDLNRISHHPINIHKSFLFDAHHTLHTAHRTRPHHIGSSPFPSVILQVFGYFPPLPCALAPSSVLQVAAPRRAHAHEAHPPPGPLTAEVHIVSVKLLPRKVLLHSLHPC